MSAIAGLSPPIVDLDLDDLRSSSAQIEFLLRRAQASPGRLPANAGELPGRRRPRADVAPTLTSSAAEPKSG